MRQVTDADIVAHVGIANRAVDSLDVSREPREDIKQERDIGILRALRTYDPAKGPLSNWIYRIVRGDLQHYLRDRALGRAIRIPGWLYEEITRLKRATSRLEHRLGRKPEASELAGELGITDERLRFIREAYERGPHASLEGADVDPATAVDTLSVDDRVAVQQCIASMPRLMRRVATLYWFCDMNQAEIARATGYCQGHIHYTLRRARKHLRRDLSGNNGDTG